MEVSSYRITLVLTAGTLAILSRDLVNILLNVFVRNYLVVYLFCQKGYLQE